MLVPVTLFEIRSVKQMYQHSYIRIWMVVLKASLQKRECVLISVKKRLFKASMRFD